MRGKRSKQYRKLMQQYSLTFGFREPYQVLVDAQMIQDAEGFKMDLVGGLGRVLHGKVKPMITQCCIRHLYTLPSIPQPQKDTYINMARGMERRRCNHHILDEPLSALECLSSVIDPKKSRTNKNCYVVASQSEAVRRYCRSVKGVPLVYVKRSVMVMEPMAESSVGVREGVERGKFRTGLRGKGQISGAKRKRADDDINDLNNNNNNDDDNNNGPDEAETVNTDESGIAQAHAATAQQQQQQQQQQLPKRKRTRGPKGPNPLSVKKPKREIKGQETPSQPQPKAKTTHQSEPEHNNNNNIATTTITESPTVIQQQQQQQQSPDETQIPSTKRKRKRKHKIPLRVALGDDDRKSPPI